MLPAFGMVMTFEVRIVHDSMICVGVALCLFAMPSNVRWFLKRPSPSGV